LPSRAAIGVCASLSLPITPLGSANVESEKKRFIAMHEVLSRCFSVPELEFGAPRQFESDFELVPSENTKS
jgi:hypothetical protein